MSNQVRENMKSLEHQTVQYNQVARIVGDLLHRIEVSNFDASKTGHKSSSRVNTSTLSASSVLTEDQTNTETKMLYEEKVRYRCQYGVLINGKEIRWEPNGREGEIIETWVLSGIAPSALFKLLNNDLDQIVKYTNRHPDIISRIRSAVELCDRKTIIKEIYYATTPKNHQWVQEVKYKQVNT